MVPIADSQTFDSAGCEAVCRIVSSLQSLGGRSTSLLRHDVKCLDKITNVIEIEPPKFGPMKDFTLVFHLTFWLAL
jgi:hypothetical protein